MKEYLNADRLNFLVWRYLLESNYREAALKLQKEWGISEPHRHFDFAQYVQCHSLVYVVNKGLSYAHLERLSEKANRPESDPDSPEIGFFGPVTEPESLTIAPSIEYIPPTKPAEPQSESRLEPKAAAPSVTKTNGDYEEGEADADGEADEEVVTKQEETDVAMQDSSDVVQDSPNGAGSGDDASGRKRPLSTQIPHASKKAKLTENGKDNSMAMDIDTGTDVGVVNNAYPSPQEGDEPEVAPRTDGPEHGTVEQIIDLGSQTTFLDLSVEKPGAMSTPASEMSQSTPLPALLLCEWSPSKANMIMAAGTDSLSRLYTISSDTSRDDEQPFCRLLEEEASRNTQVTALSWSKADGNPIAIATEHEGQARVNIWAGDGTRLNAIDIAVGPVYKLAWNEQGTILVSISPLSESEQLVSAYQVPELRPITQTIQRKTGESGPLDVAWISNRAFMVAGGSLLQQFTVFDESMSAADPIELDAEDDITKISYEWQEKVVALSSSQGNIVLVHSDGRRERISAHNSAITNLQWQPTPTAQTTPPGTPVSRRLLASASEEGVICVWEPQQASTGSTDAKAQGKKFLSISGGPIVALAFAPDGNYLAGATEQHVYIWRMSDLASIPYAKWERPEHPGWNGSTTESEEGGVEAFEHCLSWDVTSSKVAYGVNSRLALIRVR